MNRFLKITLAMATIATATWSCEKPPAKLEANNSCLLGNVNVPFVWTGIETDEDNYTIHLATTTPELIEAPMSIEGLTITLPATELDTDILIGSEGVVVSLNGVNVVDGKVKVTLSGTTLSVNVSGAQLDGTDFSAHWDGTFVSVEKSDLPEYDETLKNQWQYDGGNKTFITYAEFEAVKEGIYNGISFSFSDAAPYYDTNLGWLLKNVIGLYVPLTRVGTEFALMEDTVSDSWDFRFWLDDGTETYYAGEGANLNNVAKGRMKITKDGTQITFKLAVEFDDGKVLKANFSGTAKDLDSTDPMPGNNQWVYDGVFTDIDPLNVEYRADWEDVGVGVFDLYDASEKHNLMFVLPVNMCDGRTIPLVKDSNYRWQTYFTDGVHTQNDYYESQSGSGNLVSGEVQATFDNINGTFSVTCHIVYQGDIHFRANFTGSITNYQTQTISSIDELVGTWYSYETLLGGNPFVALVNNHSITITKIDNNTIEISNLTDANYGIEANTYGDRIRATIDSNMGMIIVANQELTPTWYEGCATHILPFINRPFESNWNAQFPVQRFVKSSKAITMRMSTGSEFFTTTATGSLQFRATYGTAIYDGSEVLGNMGIACDTYWVKTIY